MTSCFFGLTAQNMTVFQRRIGKFIFLRSAFSNIIPKIIFKLYFRGEFRRPGFTVEAGRGANPLPLSQYGELRAEVFPLLAAAMEG